MAGLRDHRESAGGAGGPGLPILRGFAARNFRDAEGEDLPISVAAKGAIRRCLLVVNNVVIGVETRGIGTDQPRKEKIIVKAGGHSKTQAIRSQIIEFINESGR